MTGLKNTRRALSGNNIQGPPGVDSLHPRPLKQVLVLGRSCEGPVCTPRYFETRKEWLFLSRFRFEVEETALGGRCEDTAPRGPRGQPVCSLGPVSWAISRGACRCDGFVIPRGASFVRSPSFLTTFLQECWHHPYFRERSQTFQGVKLYATKYINE